MAAKNKEKEKVDAPTTIKAIAENYTNLEKSIVKQLQFYTPEHGSTTGSFRESVWISLFEQIVPKKFSIEQGVFIIDSFGSISNEVDIAIFDETYTPYIFNFGKIKFIPIEAVAVVIECKSETAISDDGLKKWVKSIDILKTSSESVFRAISGIIQNDIVKRNNLEEIQTISQTATRPIKILCCISPLSNVENFTMDKEVEHFDIYLSAQNEDLEKKIIGGKESYYYWYKELNHSIEKYNTDECGHLYEKYKKIMKVDSKIPNDLADKTIDSLAVNKGNEESKKGKKTKKSKENGENVILSLTMQLNQLLMLINNPIPFPHKAYTDMFNRNLNGKKEMKSDES